MGRLTVGGGVNFDDWSEVRLVTTAAAGDWLAVCWVEGEGDWLEVCWVAGEGDWLEVCWVARAEFASSWPRVSVSSSFLVEKMWIDASGTDMEYFGHRFLLF